MCVINKPRKVICNLLFLTSNCVYSVTWFFRNECHHFLQPIFAILLHHDLKNICSLQPHSHFYLETTYASKHGPIMHHLSELVPLPLTCNY